MALAISIISLLIAVLAFIRDTLVSTKITFRKTALVYEIATLENETVTNDFVGVGVEIALINKSKLSIDFFDICFRDKKTGELLPCIDKMALQKYSDQNHFIFKSVEGYQSLSNLMNTNYGVLRPYSFLRMETVVFPKSNEIEMTIHFPKNIFSSIKRDIKLTDQELASCATSVEILESLQSKS